MKKEFILKTEHQTSKIGEKIGKLISSKFSIFLYGDLGSGKTTFTKGLAQGLGISDKYYITSPTYNIINEYPGTHLFLYHIDLYRIQEVFELDELGMDEIMSRQDAIVAIEWPELLEDIPSYSNDLKINLSINQNNSRKISIFASGRKGANLLKKLLL